jgi:hypothetical protein
MRVISKWNVDPLASGRTITLVEGDLTAPSVDVDLLVVSAFPHDYAPTPQSLMGALDRAGISVARLAESKALDLRDQCSCWLSNPVALTGRVLRVLCIESGWRGSPPEIADDVFRALATMMFADVRDAVVAMPIIGVGDQRYAIEQMLPVILRSAVGWLKRGLAVRELRIVVRSDAVETAQRLFNTARDAGQDDSRILEIVGAVPVAASCDVFLSYSHQDAALALAAHDVIKAVKPDARIFFDRATLAPGDSWLMQIAEALDAARRVLALYTPNYWSSRFCRDEFVAAFTRQQDTGLSLLYPLHLRTVNVPYLFRSVQYADCREDDMGKLSDAARDLASQLS